MGINDGFVSGVEQIRNRGLESLNWNLVIVGDGFDIDQQGDFADQARSFVDQLETFAPFDGEISGEFNVFRIDVVSDDSGAENPLTCPDATGPIGGETTARTYFDAQYCAPPPEGQNIRRLLTVDTDLVETTANDYVPEWDAVLVIVNHDEYGGSGGADVAVASVGTPWTVPIHELGHSAFGLGDEYCDLGGCYSGTEPDEPNITITTDLAELKWGHLVTAVNIPTLENNNNDSANNPDCPCDTQPSPVAVGTVGLFEGGDRRACDIYRPEYDCMMRTNGVPFCQVCQYAIAGLVRQEIFFGECFVSSAVYGDPHHPDVLTFRQWRDRHLRRPWPGRIPMTVVQSVYGIAGPPAARWISRRPLLAVRCRRSAFEPLARRLRR